MRIQLLTGLLTGWLAMSAVSAQVSKFEAGLALYHGGQCREALEQWNASEKAGESQPARQFYQGVCLAKLGRWPEASAQLLSYSRAQPSDSHGWYWLGRTQFFQHQFAEARTSVQRAIQLNGSSAEAYKALGEIELELRNHDAAYHAWLTANKLDPRDPQTTYYLGRLFYEAEFMAEAADWLRETLRLDPKHFGAMTYLGMCAEHLGQNDAAGRFYQAAIRESKLQGKPFSWSFLSYGKFLRQQGKESEAIRVLEEAERSCPEAHVLSTLGQALAAEHHTSRAEAVLRRAIEMDASISEAHYRLSLLLRDGGQLDEAQIELKKYQDAKKLDEQNKTRISAIRK